MKKETEAVQLRNVIGNNIRDLRISRNLSIDELSDLLELSPGFVGLIERGQRGTTPLTLKKLSNIFSISIDSLFIEYQKTSSFFHLTEFDEPAKIKRKKIHSMIVNFTVKELDLILSVVKGVIDTIKSPE